MKQSMKNLTKICNKKLEYVILDNILDHSSHWSRQPSLYIRCTVCAGTFILYLFYSFEITKDKKKHKAIYYRQNVFVDQRLLCKQRCIYASHYANRLYLSGISVNDKGRRRPIKMTL